MKFKRIEKKEAGKFITRYDIHYETVDHQEKVYEMISRNKNLTTREEPCRASGGRGCYDIAQ